MAENLFLKLEGIDGEAMDTGHKKWIMIQSCQWGVSRAVEVNVANQDRSYGNAEVQPFTIGNTINKASPHIQHHAVNGVPIALATIHFTRTGNAGNKALDWYMEYELKDCMITNYSSTGGNDSVPTEEFTLSSTFMKLKYRTAERGSNKLEDGGNWEWNFATNADT